MWRMEAAELNFRSTAEAPSFLGVPSYNKFSKSPLCASSAPIKAMYARTLAILKKKLKRDVTIDVSEGNT